MNPKKALDTQKPAVYNAHVKGNGVFGPDGVRDASLVFSRIPQMKAKASSVSQNMEDAFSFIEAERMRTE